MRKSLVLFLLCLMCSVQSAQANIFSIGPRLGGSFAQLKIRENAQKFTISNRFGYHCGVVARVNLVSFFVQPEILLVGSRVYVSKDQDEFKLSFTKLDVPVMVGFSLFGVRLQAGPALSLLFSAVHEKDDLEQAYKYFTLGYQAGVGYDILHMMIDLKYEGNLTKFGSRIAGLRTDHRLHQIVLSVGVSLL